MTCNCLLAWSESCLYCSMRFTPYYYTSPTVSWPTTNQPTAQEIDYEKLAAKIIEQLKDKK